MPVDRERALAALVDAFLPGGHPRSTRSDTPAATDDLPAASVLGVHHTIRREVEALGRPAEVAELDQLLDTLESPLLNLALAGTRRPFSALPQAEREAYLKRWAASPLPLLRKAFQVAKRLTFLYAYGMDASPYARAMGYENAVLDRAAPRAEIAARLPVAGERIDADAIVVGSGAGGGVAAATLARAGKRVVVLERAPLRLESEFDGRELAGYAGLFLDRGIASTADRAISLLAGSAVGGGTIVNWNTCLRLPDGVREEWRAAGIDGLDPYYAAVESRLDVDTDESARNGPNDVLERGLAALGREARTIARNVKGCGDCGHCTFGCRRGAKQSTLRTYLVDACAGGAEILHSTEARVITAAKGAVTGVVARVPGGEVVVRAPLVALSGGALLSPALLLRSGIAAAQAGRHLHLHPVAIVVGAYEEETVAWHGVPQSVLGDGFADLRDGYGFRLECPPAYPGILAAALPWWGSDFHFDRARRGRHLAPFIAIVRDREGGRVTIDRAGEPRYHYECGPLERELLVEAMVESARIHVAAGAREVATLHTPPLILEDPSLADAFARTIRARGAIPNRVTLFSAHQMSSCRIGTSPRSSVADPDGKVWDVDGLFVTDASAFPSAAGVNPMLTVMALAGRTAARMV